VKRLVLVGAGHAHAQVLLAWARRPAPGTELVLVSPQSRAPYSGMVPGWLAGAYRFDEIVVDFAALCAAAGARWVPGELQSLDAQQRNLQLANGDTLDYDLLSLNLGSTLNPPPTAAATLLSMRPLARLHDAWEEVLRRWQRDADDAPYRVTAVGGGAAGFESLLAALARLRALRPQRRVLGCLVSRGNRLLLGLAPVAVRAAQRALSGAGVRLELGTPWSEALAARSDLVLWATGAEAHAWQADAQRRGGLAVSERGFIRVDPGLRSVSHPQVYAVGDCAEWAQPLPKAGVYAVRMGPVLEHNLRAALGQGAPIAYVPQRRCLVLLATADGRAIASRGGLGGAGRWVWRWKDHIDRRFIARFATPAQPVPAATNGSTSDSPNDAA
jgi:pyridine nucleotide-disulfide oxidoreductase family protein